VFLSAIWYEQGVYRQGIGVLDLKSGKAKILIRDGGCPYYLPTGHLLFTRQDALFAVPFDVGRLEVKGEPVAIMDGLFQSKNWINARFGIASDGTVLYPPGGNVSRNRRLIVVGRDGKVSEWSGERQAYEFWIAASPDGARTTTAITNANAITEVWISERGRLGSHRLPTPQGVDILGAAWSPDGSLITYYASSQSAEDGLYIASADGTSPPRRIVGRVAGAVQPPSSWSPDGSTIIVNLVKAGTPLLQTAVIPSNPESLAELKPMFHDEAPRGFGTFSPSGRSIAYLSLETGRPEVFVSGWDGRALVGRPVLVSVGGGITPRWERNGKKLYFQTPQEKVMAVDVVEGPPIRASAPVEVWDLEALRIARSDLGGVMDILPDGRLLAVQRGEGEGTPTRIDVVVNFPEEMKARFAAAKK
jgi:eukaryotic-like serine/threonine-protein kinase